MRDCSFVISAYKHRKRLRRVSAQDIAVCSKTILRPRCDMSYIPYVLRRGCKPGSRRVIHIKAQTDGEPSYLYPAPRSISNSTTLTQSSSSCVFSSRPKGWRWYCSVGMPDLHEQLPDSGYLDSRGSGHSTLTTTVPFESPVKTVYAAHCT